MLLHTRKYPISGKEGKVVMLPKPMQNEEEKLKPDN
jgi:hypothetical protein